MSVKVHFLHSTVNISQEIFGITVKNMIRAFIKILKRCNIATRKVEHQYNGRLQLEPEEIVMPQSQLVSQQKETSPLLKTLMLNKSLSLIYTSAPNAHMCGRDSEPALCCLRTVCIPFTTNQNLSVFLCEHKEN